MIAIVSNMSLLQFPNSNVRPVTGKCNRCAVLCRCLQWAIPLVFAVILPLRASAQSSSAGQTLQSPPADEHRVLDTVNFLSGAAVALALHESGHLVFDGVFDAGPRITGVHFGP